MIILMIRYSLNLVQKLQLSQMKKINLRLPESVFNYLQRLRIFEQYSDVGDGDMVGNINREEDGGGEAEETAQHSRLFRLNYAIPRDNHNPCINIVNGGTNVMLIAGFY